VSRSTPQKTAENKKLFLEMYKDLGSVEAVVAEMVKKGVGITNRDTVYLWQNKDSAFLHEFAILKESRTDQIEDNMAQIALGTKEAKKSELIAGMFWLTHNRREIYGGSKYGPGRLPPGQVQRVERQEIIKSSTGAIRATREVREIHEEIENPRLPEGDLNGNSGAAEE
jgi:hypothetical protein